MARWDRAGFLLLNVGIILVNLLLNKRFSFQIAMTTRTTSSDEIAELLLYSRRSSRSEDIRSVLSAVQYICLQFLRLPTRFLELHQRLPVSCNNARNGYAENKSSKTRSFLCGTLLTLMTGAFALWGHWRG
jgi:hypothetical protein